MVTNIGYNFLETIELDKKERERECVRGKQFTHQSFHRDAYYKLKTQVPRKKMKLTSGGCPFTIKYNH